ncbi:CBO0543 family protein [Sporosarcina sp. HYO08]|uniref:CBO0543 family protein n=1 Tax=Sporosarcina sp. HYO08 TaxID=1759557 RepID=UPI00079C303A|nr:CBO0543 family protein [Sporosarcina sp. HYO08]KXH81921.1 hypothetical protein AU377_06565 [Sporosarcina sp. HYO08]
MELWFVEKNFYTFSIRPFPEIFSINIAFTLLLIPSITFIYLLVAGKMASWLRLIFTIALCAFVPYAEEQAVQYGFLSLGDQWNSYYSSVGYFIFLVLIWKLYKWNRSIAAK